MSIGHGRRVLVTGGGGFLGHRVVELLKGIAGTHVLALRRVECDLTDAAQVERLFSTAGKLDAVIHLAAVVGGIGANMKRPGEFFMANMTMGLNVVEGARKHGVDRFVHTATVCSYPKFTPVPFKESDLWNGFPEETNAPYGVAKKALIMMLQAYKAQYGMKSAVVIPTNLYGPGDNFDPASSHVIPAMIRKFEDARLADAPHVTLWGTGSASREFLYVQDAAEALVKASQTIDDPDPINLGTGMEISIRDLAAKVRDATGYRGQMVWDTTKPDGQPRRCLDISRARERLHWEAHTGFDHGLAQTVAWYRQSSAGPRPGGHGS